MRICCTILAATLSVCSAAGVDASIDIQEVWKGHSAEFAKAMQSGAGFSFQFGGKLVGPDFSGDWQQTTVAGTTTGVTTTILTHASGLVVSREMRFLPDFGAVEYKIIFKNTAKKALPPVSSVHALNISLGESILDGNCIISSGGGLAEGVLPPRTFAIRKSCFSSAPEYAAVELATEGGRSSNKDLPFWLIHNGPNREGLFAAIGWSGQWAATVRREPTTKTLRVKGKIPDLDIALEPGEELQGPTVLLGLYQGEVADGSNRLRRIIRDVYAPKLAGETFSPIATYDTWFGVGLKFDEVILRQLAEGAAGIGQEYFLLDAGWYAGTEGDADFSSGVGNWYEIDQRKLPNGIKPIADYVRSKGLKFGLWFEPERVADGSQLAKAHPEWILWARGQEPGSWWRDDYPELFRTGRHYGLLDYGRPEVQRWVREMLDQHIRDYGVKYIRYDFNLDPLPYWEAHDKPHRRGLTQIKHIQGFYSIVDWIRARHPDVVLEGCASGGRRIDLETARRFHTNWISDYTADPEIIRFHLFGINHFLPGSYHYVQYTVPSIQLKTFQADDLGFQNLFAGAFGTGGRVDLWPEEMKRKARLHVETWKKLRRYLIEDYYPLSQQPGDQKSWSGWQFLDPNDQSGFIQTFRTNTPDQTHRFFLRGLETQVRYRFTDAYSAESFEISGASAMTEGVDVTQAGMSSRVLIYRKD